MRHRAAFITFVPEASLDTAIRIVGAAGQELSSDADGFYEAYWSEGATVAAETTARQIELLGALFPEAPTEKRVLELGVGAEGGLVGHLKATNDVVGLDASPVAVASCTKLGIPAQRFNADRDTIPFPDDHFDIVFAFEVCEHLANPQFAIEEIRRVLKPGGRFVASTPNPLTHHWPRYFYPQLIERAAFRELLMVNKFRVVEELGLATHWYDNLVTTPLDKAWSWIWSCQNVKQHGDQLLEIARTFWTRFDEHGIRSRPMEAADLARAAKKISATDVDACGLLAATQVYRLVNGESQEFLECVSSLVAEAQGQGTTVLDAKYWLCVTEIELAKFNRSMVAEADFRRIFTEVGENRPDRAAELTELLRDALALAARL